MKKILKKKVIINFLFIINSKTKKLKIGKWKGKREEERKEKKIRD